MNDQNPHGVPNPPPYRPHRPGWAEWKVAILLAAIPILLVALIVAGMVVYQHWSH